MEQDERTSRGIFLHDWTDPISLEEARQRAEYFRGRAAEVNQQLAQAPRQRLDPEADVAHQAWRSSAKNAVLVFNTHVKRLNQWIFQEQERLKAEDRAERIRQFADDPKGGLLLSAFSLLKKLKKQGCLTDPADLEVYGDIGTFLNGSMKELL
ncbi:MAG: hypothetical protein V4671_02325 [Armatimonadota bacterium]